MGVPNCGQQLLMMSFYQIRQTLITTPNQRRRLNRSCVAALQVNTQQLRATHVPGGDGAAGRPNLIGNQGEANCFRPRRLYINMQRRSERLDVCLITVLAVVRVGLSGRVVTRSDRLGTAERVRPTAAAVPAKLVSTGDTHRVVEVHVCRAYAFTAVCVCVC